MYHIYRSFTNLPCQRLEAHDGFVVVPKASVIPPPEIPDTKPGKGIVSHTSPVVLPKLSWSIEPNELKANSKAVKIALQGTNKTNAKLYFANIRIKFSSG